MTALRSRTLFLLFLLLLSSLSPLFYYNFLDHKLLIVPRYLPPPPPPPPSPPPPPQRNLTVLLWHWPFGRRYRLDENRCLSMYNISHCLLTDKAAALPHADVVVFHHQELNRGLGAPPPHKLRPNGQHWVWLSMEPPVNNAHLAPLNGLFNWTMSYRRDADIFVPYGETLVGGGEPDFRPAFNRSCLVGWVVSRYREHQARSAVYQRLRKLLPIQVYGKWNGKPLSDRKLLPTIGRCFFYLSLENSEAKDYVSEKLWRNALQAGTVPVVLGPSRDTYEALAPPRSFIHVKDFEETADLAEYLRGLAADRQAYEEFFHWRRTHRVRTYTDWRERLCQICVQYPGLAQKKIYQDLEGWVNS